MGIVQKSNINVFLQQLGVKTTKVLNEMGTEGLKVIKDQTPIDTGDLKGANFFEIIRTRLWFVNPLFYAPYVELGTYRMNANPFMRRGIKMAYPQFTTSIINGLKV